MSRFQQIFLKDSQRQPTQTLEQACLSFWNRNQLLNFKKVSVKSKNKQTVAYYQTHVAGPYHLFFQIDLNCNSFQLRIQGSLFQGDYKKLGIVSHQVGLLITRYLSASNNTLSNCIIFYHRQSKSIRARHISQFRSQQFSTLVRQKPKQLADIITGAMDRMAECLRKDMLPRILFFCNKLTPETASKIKSSIPEPVKKGLKAVLAQATKLFQNNQNRKAQLIEQSSKSLLNPSNPKSNQKLQNQQQNSITTPNTRILNQIGRYFLQSSNQSILYNSKDPIISEAIPKNQADKLLRRQQLKPINAEDPREMIVPVWFAPTNRWELREQTRFSKISVGYNSITLAPQKINFINKNLAKKIAVGQEGTKRIKNEVQILKRMKGKRSLNINRYYYKNETADEEIYSDYCQLRSLDKYAQSNRVTLSMLSKVFLLSHAAQGIKFLRDCKIIHCDVKTNNILVGRGLIAKVCDFGDSLPADRGSASSKEITAITPMYSPPEVCSLSRKATLDLDTYSLAIVLYELLNNRLPFNMRNQSLGVTEYCRAIVSKPGLSRFSTPPERYANNGLQQLMLLLVRLCLLGMDSTPEYRIDTDQMVLILKLGMYYLTRSFLQ